MYSNRIVLETNLSSTNPRIDGTADVLIWLTAEVTATIMAACIPFYRPLVRKVAGKASRGQKPESYGLSQRSGINRLGSRGDVKSGFREASADDSSDRAIIDYQSPDGMTKSSARVEYNSYYSATVDVGVARTKSGHGRDDEF